MSIQIRERAVPKGTVLELAGDLTYANREPFKSAVEAVRLRGIRRLVLDMAGVRFVDSSGLGLLALVAQSFKAMQGRVCLLRPQAYVREIMMLANIHSLIPLYDNEQELFRELEMAA